jgi:hypothetical protein
MDQKSQLKVIKAGFRILRIDDQPSPRIKIKDKTSMEWHTLEDCFKSKAARDRRFNELLVSNIFISD